MRLSFATFARLAMLIALGSGTFRGTTVAAATTKRTSSETHGVFLGVGTTTKSTTMQPPKNKDAFFQKKGVHMETLLSPRFIKVEANVLTPEECAQILKDSPEESLFEKQYKDGSLLYQTHMTVTRDIFNRFVHHQSGSSSQEDEDIAGDYSLPITRLEESSVPHQDHYAGGRSAHREKLGQLVNEPVVLMYLNDNPDAVFVYGDERVPAMCGTKVTFHGGYVHHTEVAASTGRSGDVGAQPVKFLGPTTANPQAYRVQAPGPAPSGKCFTEETTVRMADGSLKAFADIEIGDDVAKGGLVTSVVTFAQEESAPGLCRIDDNLVVTRMHMVLDDQESGGVFVPAMNMLESDDLCNEHADFVYDIETKNHVIEFENGIVATDFSEHDIIPEFFEIEKEMALAKVKSLHQDKLLNQDSLFLYDVYFAGESLVKMQDGSFKAIQDIELNEHVSLGGKVVGVYKIDGSHEDRMCRLAPNVVVSNKFLMYANDGAGAGAGAFVEADYGSTCQETPVKTLYHLDTEAHLIELEDNVFTLDYQEHDDLDAFFEKEVEMTKNLVDIVAKSI